MPTGYTARLYEGEQETFPEFALNCARAFGALIELRDSPDATIPERFEPAPYHLNKADTIRAELEDIRAWSPEQADHEAQQHARTENRRIAKVSDKLAATKERYEAMLAQARAWQPPTAEHDGLKKFMIQQLEESIRFDCDYTIDPVPILKGEAFRAQREGTLLRDLAYHLEQHAKEIERAEGRTRWLQALRESLEN